MATSMAILAFNNGGSGRNGTDSPGQKPVHSELSALMDSQDFMTTNLVYKNAT